jgi:serine/threonine protein kinase
VDVWALGVVAFEMLSGGHAPFVQANQGERHFAVLRKTPLYGSYPVFKDPNVRDFIKRCLTVDEKKRPSALTLLSHGWLKEYQ